MSNEYANVFNVLNKIDMSGKVKQKNGLTYLSWASAWAEVKRNYPDATFRIIPQVIDNCGGESWGGNTRFWHTDGVSGWVEVGVTICGVELIETLAIMNHKNQAIPAADITSVDANKSIKRCLVKACAMHGLGMYIYEGEDLPDDVSKTIVAKDEIKELISKRASLSDKAKDKVAELCKAAEKSAFPDMDEADITGRYADIEDIDILTDLARKLRAVRK